MKSFRALAIVLAITVGLGVLAGGCGRGQQAAYPSKPIDFVVHTDPGGGSDVFVRMIADIVQKEKLSSQPINVVNKGGGSGAVAIQYLLEKKGDPYTILAFATVIGSTMARGQVSGKMSDLTPIACLQMDPSVLQVRADSPYNSLADLIKAAKEKPKQISAGFGSIGSTDHILLFRLQKLTGAQFNFLTFKSGGEAATQMLGGHVDFTLGQPVEAKGQIEAKKVKALATFTDKRLPILPDVPTAKEVGFDVPSKVYRAVVGPPDIPKDAVSYLETMFKKVTETPQWKDYVVSSAVEPKYLNAADWGKLLAEEYKEIEAIITEMGLKEKK